jgi:anti-sigma28 factor (negative regulator of flagellin synthesis)
MRIDDLSRTTVTQAAEQCEQATPQGPSVESAAAGPEDEAAHFAQSIEASDPIRIEQLRQQVLSGSYDVSTHKVADAVIDAHLDEYFGQ